jgi:hypothetical protein
MKMIKTTRRLSPKLSLLKRIDPALRLRFIESFASDFAGKSPALPPTDLPEDHYLDALIHLLMSSEELPVRFSEAAGTIADLSSDKAAELLQTALRQAGVRLDPQKAWTAADMAVLLWLEDPQTAIHLHNRGRLRRLTSFVYFGAATPPPKAGTGISETGVEQLVANLDKWFAEHNRGHKTVRIQRYTIDAEIWFLIRHGDIAKRTPKVEEQRTEILHFRPERDDVVVYSPDHDRIRINARTRAERELYRREFGLLLHDTEDYFSRSDTYTLEPLRTDGAAALDPQGIDGLADIKLRELEVASGNDLNEVNTREADNLFLCEAAPGSHGPIPLDGRLVRAAFDVKVTGCPRPRSFQIRPPNTLRLCRHCNPQAIHRWLARNGFIRS